LSTPDPHSGERLRRQYSFGDFTLDLERGVLWRGVEEVTLRPKAYEVLTYLVEHHSALVTMTALIDAVWPDTAVMDNSLAQCLVEIRRALGDDSQQLIRTVARRGYLFTAPVTTPVVEFPRRLPVPPSPATGLLNRRTLLGACVLALAAGALLLWPTRPVKQDLTYTQITNFTDSAVSPALSPDGKMLAFIRSENWFGTPDQICEAAPQWRAGSDHPRLPA
jgi:DNA-binding winged helix-turn-helix (wHTH) protein